jgi:hypothetical protein
VDSARSSAAVGLVIGGALILNYVVASENIPNIMAQALVGLEVHPITFLIGVNILLLLLGCVLDATTIILVIIPLFLPTCRELGIDLVHFGVVAVINCMIGLITPPYGILLFVINAVTQIPLREIIGEIMGVSGRADPGPGGPGHGSGYRSVAAAAVWLSRLRSGLAADPVDRPGDQIKRFGLCGRFAVDPHLRRIPGGPEMDDA